MQVQLTRPTELKTGIGLGRLVNLSSQNLSTHFMSYVISAKWIFKNVEALLIPTIINKSYVYIKNTPLTDTL